MDRGVLTYSAAYLTGIITSIFAPIPACWAILAATTLLSALYLYKKNTIIFTVCSHIAILTCGMGICANSRESTHLPPDRFSITMEEYSQKLQENIANRFREMVPNPESHAILCALSIGEKSFMGKELKRSFSKAGAMHVLALSGLHIGIAFAIIYTLLLPLITIPGGGKVRNVIALLFIAWYSILAGCSPSVIRAATMIFLYKIAKGKFRTITNWDAIAISAMIICTISPLQIKDIGFQLSYSAVIGIALLFPTCNRAFIQLVPKWSGWKGYIWEGVYWLWGCIAISVCCQIATMPASLYHFGYCAPHFLLANLIAVPVATAILYALTAALFLQWIPVVGELAIYALNTLINILNSSISFIAN